MSKTVEELTEIVDYLTAKVNEYSSARAELDACVAKVEKLNEYLEQLNVAYEELHDVSVKETARLAALNSARQTRIMTLYETMSKLT
jgi:predicted  nucleic acid-binding Zn-ribbon protein